MLRGMNCVNYSGTATYTFRNEESFPVTIAFPPICYYTYSSRKSGLAIPLVGYSSTITWQEQPFPDDKRRVPDFARQQRNVVIPPGQSIAFTSPFNIGCPDGHPNLNCVFVFGMPARRAAIRSWARSTGRRSNMRGRPKTYATEDRP